LTIVDPGGPLTKAIANKRHEPIRVGPNAIMRSASRVLRFVCLLLAALLWVVTLITDPTPGAITAAAALTAIIALMIALTSFE